MYLLAQMCDLGICLDADGEYVLKRSCHRAWCRVQRRALGCSVKRSENNLSDFLVKYCWECTSKLYPYDVLSQKSQHRGNVSPRTTITGNEPIFEKAHVGS